MKHATTLITPVTKQDLMYSTMQMFNTGDKSTFAGSQGVATNNNLETQSMKSGNLPQAPAISAFRGDRVQKSNKQSSEQLKATSAMENSAIVSV